MVIISFFSFKKNILNVFKYNNVIKSRSDHWGI